MPRGERITAIRSYEPYEVGLTLGRPVVRLLDKEAVLHGMKRLEFFRALLLRHVGVLALTRSRRAPPRRLVGARTHEKQRMPITLGPGPLSVLLEMSNCLGSGSKSTIVSHLILDWAGISPLGIDRAFPRRRRSRASARRAEPSKTLVLPLATPVLAIVEAEARAMAVSRAELIRELISVHAGQPRIRGVIPHRTREPISNRAHTKKRLSVMLGPGHIRFLDEVAARLGGGERATIISHLVLDWAGISPLRSDFRFRSVRRRRTPYVLVTEMDGRRLI